MHKRSFSLLGDCFTIRVKNLKEFKVLTIDPILDKETH